jgi:hypothetical protein
VPTNALSAAARTTTHSPGTAANLLPIDKFLFARPPKLSYVDFSSSVIHRLPYPSSSHEHSLIFDRVLHPYSPDAFESLLRKHNLLDSYPLLPNNLRFGFPLGFMPPILQTVIIPNNPSILPHMTFIQEYLSKELVAGRISGPFAREETELILRGPFQSSPLIVSAQPQEPGIPDKLRICRHLSKATKSHASVNSHIRKDDFPTRFDMALAVAGIVSPTFLFLPQSTFICLLCDPFAFRAWDCRFYPSLFKVFVHEHVTWDISPFSLSAYYV